MSDTGQYVTIGPDDPELDYLYEWGFGDTEVDSCEIETTAYQI